MADNEIKVKISAENVEFLRKIQECIKALNQQDKAVKDADKSASSPPSGRTGLDQGIKAATQSAEKFLGKLRAINQQLEKVRQIAAAVQLPVLKPTVDIAAAQRAITSLGTLMRGLADITPKLTLDTGDAKARIQNLANEIGKIKNATVKVDLQGVNADNVKINLDTALAKQRIRDLQRMINEIKSNGVRIDINMSGAAQALAALQTQLGKLKSANIKIELDAGTATQTAKGIANELQKIKSKKISITLKSNVTAAEINRINTLLGKLKSANLTVSINTASAMANLNRLRTLITQIRQELAQIRMPTIDLTGITALLAALARLEQQARRTRNILDQIRGPGGGGGGGGGSGGMLGMLSQLTVAAAGVLAVLGQIKDVAAAIIMPGFNYTKEMETTQLGITGILQSMTLLDGKAVSFGDAMGISADMMKKLQRDAILTSATTEEMVTTFRALLAPGIGAGMNIDEIEELTKVGVNAVKAIGLNNMQFVQELRDLVQGGIQASSSTLATSLGLTDADIKAAKASSEGLFKFLMDRLAGFDAVSKHFPETLEGKMSQLKEVSVLASAEITERFKDDFKEIIGSITSWIADINMETGEITINPAITGVIDEISEGIQSIKDYMLDIEESGAMDWVDDAIPALKSLWNILGDICGIIMDLAALFEASQAPIRSFTFEGIRGLANDIEWLTAKIREFIGLFAKKLGVKKERSHDWWAEQAKDSANKVTKDTDTSKLTEKFESRTAKEAAKAAEKAEKERIKASQKALKEALKYWKNQLDLIQRGFKKQQEALKLRLDQKTISSDQYHMSTLQKDITEKSAEIKIIEGRIKDTEGASFTTEDEKKNALDTLYQERDNANADLTDLSKAMKEMTGVMEKMNTMTVEQAVKKYGLDPNGFDKPSGAGPMYQQAQSAAAYIGVPAEWVYAQWGHESSDFTSKLAKENNNFGGLTQVENNGAENKQPDGDFYYMEFATPEKYAEYFAKYIKKYYPEAASAKTPEEYAKALKAGGYYGASYEEYIGGMKARMGKAQTPQVGEGNTWYKVAAENPKYDALEGNAKQALESVAAYYKKLTGQQLGLSSGKRSADLGYAQEEIGGHGSGMKFDAVAEALNDPEIRQKVIDFAKSVGLEVLDEYADPTAKASGKHLDFNAKNFKVPAQGADRDMGELQARQTYEMYMARMAMRDKAKGFLKQYQGLIGDISTYQLEEITKQYEDIRKELALYPGDDKAREALQVMDKLEASEKARVNFAQSQKDIGKANEDLTLAQTELFARVATGTRGAADASTEYVKLYDDKFAGILDGLEKQLAAAGDDDDLKRSIKAQIKQIQATLKDGFEALLQSIDEDLQRKIARINANPNMTNMQREDAIDEATRASYLEQNAAIGGRINYIEGLSPTDRKSFKDENGNDAQTAIANLQAQIALNTELAKTPSLIEKISIAGKQGLEDGFNSFFGDLMTGCKDVGQAFQDLGNSILQSISKVLANRLTQQFMSFLFPSQNSAGRPSTGGNLLSGPLMSGGGFFSKFADGGNIGDGGKVSGPGTGTSDSILAYMGNLKKFIRIANGEYVIKAKSVQKFGTQFFDYVNSGMIPPEIYNVHEQYASGGSLTASSAGNGAASYAVGDNIINVPVNISGAASPAMASELRNGIEDLVIQLLKKYS